MRGLNTFRIIIGVLLLLSAATIFALLFLETESIAVLFNFGIDMSVENIGDVIAGIAVGIAAGLVFFFAMIFVGIINAIIYVVLGALTLALKRKKTTLIIVSIITALALFIGVRALIILTLGGYTSIILPLRITSDVIIIVLSIISVVLIAKSNILPRVEEKT